MTKKRCCIFIDEDPYDSAIFMKALSDVSPETICFSVSNGLEALHLMRMKKIIPSYIFVELDMPEMDGIEFLQIVKRDERLREIPIIVHSTSPQPHKIIELKESGALAIYFRPYEYFGICNTLNLYFDPTMAIIGQN